MLLEGAGKAGARLLILRVEVDLGPLANRDHRLLRNQHLVIILKRLAVVVYKFYQGYRSAFFWSISHLRRSFGSLRGQWTARSAVSSRLRLVAGGIGNAIDRILFQKVTDFIELDFMRFAIFNFADMCLVVGVILFGLDLVLEEINGRNKSSETTEQPEDW